jgi:hypothetical protein
MNKVLNLIFSIISDFSDEKSQTSFEVWTSFDVSYETSQTFGLDINNYVIDVY